MKDLSAASYKIINSIKKCNYDIENFDDNETIKNITNIIRDIINTPVVNIELITESTLKPIHKKSDYPFVYILIKKLYDEGTLSKYVKDIPNLDDFNVFLKWYRENHHIIDLENIAKHHKLEDYKLLLNPADDRKKLHERLYTNSFISLDIQQCAEQSTLNYKEYKVGNVKIYLYTTTNESPNINMVIKIINIIKVFCKKSDCDIDLTIFFNKQKKYIGHENNLCPININSGSTYTGKHITIWRAEEFYKVLIHELIHYFKIDFHSDSNLCEIIESILHSKINCDNDNANESYTESIAVLLNTLIISTLSNIEFHKLLNLEITFTLFQVAKIIHFFGGKSVDDLLTKKITISQTTSVCSYFIAKLFMMLYYGKLFNIWKNGFKLTKSTKDQYIQFYDNMFKLEQKQKYIEIINNLIKKIDNIDKNNFIYKTMRMTCLELTC